MKVVLFCGGLGTRLREHSETIPKPLVNIGGRPILWHLMKYYAFHGHKEFVLCLGYRGEMIRQFFCEYDARDAEDFIMEDGICRVLDESSDVPDWKIRFIDTGLHMNIGQRLLSIREHVEDDEVFLANYSDQLSDLPLGGYLDSVQEAKSIASFVSVRPYGSFHSVHSDEKGFVTSISPVAETDNWINGGYMVLRKEVFDYLKDGEELVEEPFDRLIHEKQLYAYQYEGFWKAMDTYKDKLAFDSLFSKGERPWMVWEG